MNNSNTLSSFSESEIDDAAEKSKDNTLWGKPANDIINGRDTATQYEPVRAIWEMVQNARDVNDGNCKVEFCRRKDSFLFRHNGQPFTNDTLNALILQTSSKVRGDMEQVGQYGTGFLTTHLLGRKFELSGSLQLLDGKDCYCNFSEFVVDRTPNEKGEMIDKLKEQFEAKNKLAKRTDLRSDTPCEWTTFTYFQPNEKEHLNTKECFEKAESVIPYVMCLNPNIQSIRLKDEVEQKETMFENTGTETIDNTQEKYTVCETTIRVTGSAQPRHIVSLKSKETITTGSNKTLPKVTVLIPVEDKRVYSLGDDVARLFLYLPLIGSEKWGVNFIIHSPAFTCATENRSSLRLVDDGQGDSSVVETNREVINLAADMIFHYVGQHLAEWQDVRLLAPITFDVNSNNEDLADYYSDLKSTWFKKMYQLPLVEVPKRDVNVKPSDISVLEKSLADAAENDAELLTALYNIMCNLDGVECVPIKEHLIYWSNVFADWDCKASNVNIRELQDDIVFYLSNEELEVSEEDLLVLCKYLKESGNEKCFDKYILLTEDGGLTSKTEALKAGFSNKVLRDCLSVLMPAKTSKFLKPEFAALVQVPTFSYKEIKETMPSVVDEYNKRLEPVWKAAKASEEEVDEDEKTLLSEEERNALMDYCRLIISQTGTAFEAKVLKLIAEYHGHELQSEQDDLLVRADLEWRGCLRLLICNALLDFTLLDIDGKQEHADWVKKLVAVVYGYSDFRSLLKNFQCYRSQTGEYHYCEKLMKDGGIPDKMKDIYNKIRITEDVKEVEDIEATLFDKEFAPIADTEAKKDAPALGKLIMEEIHKSGTYLEDIDTYIHKDLVVEIIDNLNDTDEGKLWISSFERIHNDLGALLMKLVLKAESREPMIQIMKVKDTNRIKKVAEIVQDEHLMEIWELGRQAWMQQQNQQTDFDMKKQLGKYVEDYLREELSEELAGIDLTVEVDDEQGGQDIVIKKNGEIVYFIEVKSRWITADSVLMSALQLQRSVEEKDRYALFAVDMTGYNSENVKEHRYPDSKEEMVSRIKAISNIGVLNEKIIPAERNPKKDVHIGGDYKAVVPQDLINEQGKSYDEFLQKVLIPVVRGNK